MLEIRGLRKAFQGRTVVDGVDLDASSGDFLVLLGPSGCGKSTILRLIAGLEAPDAGVIRLGGRVVNDLEPRERDVAMVFQNYALYPHRDVAGNIGFPLQIARVPPAERAARVREAARLLGVEELLARKPAQLSGGQQQRVALARALVRRPALFLLDEPLSNVDARLRAEMRAELARLHREVGATMVHVTHDQAEAMTLATRLAVLHGGRVRQIGPPLEVWRRPADVLVAAFLGSPPMNLLRGPASRGLLPPGAPADAVLGFRPHEARLGGPLAARVTLVEELGDQTLLHADCGGEPLALALAPGAAPPPGAAIAVGAPAAALHLFDARDGTRLP